MKKNEVCHINITALSHEGDGIGRVDGMAVFVPMSAIGDDLEIKIVKVLKNHAYAIINRIISPSGHRVQNDCPVYKQCGGCALRHISYDHELDVKSGWVYENLKRIGGVDIVLEPPVGSPEILCYRNKAQYPVRRVDGEICAGFFKKRSHQLVRVDNCLQAPSFFGDIVRQVIDFANRFGIEPYDDFSKNGVLRHIFIRCNNTGDEAGVCLVINGETLSHSDKLIEMLSQNCAMVKTVSININTDDTNVIFGEKTVALWGSGQISDELCGVRVSLSPQSFYQVNHDAAEILYRKAFEYAAPANGDVILDLYCGAGTIGLSMAKACQEIIGVEIVSQAIADAKLTAAGNGITNARFIQGDAAAASRQLKTEGIKPDIIIVDPPRKGLDETLPATIAEFEPKKLIYISCNSSTFARDVKRLGELGFALAKAQAVDMFPRTAHVECIGLLLRK